MPPSAARSSIFILYSLSNLNIYMRNIFLSIALITSIFSTAVGCPYPAPHEAAVVVDPLPPGETTIVPEPAHATSSPYFIDLDAAEMIVCKTGPKTGRTGTVDIIDQDTWITAAHVVVGTQACNIFGEPAEVTYVNEELDIAVVKAKTGPITRFPINCSGIAAGHVLLALGYAGDRYVMNKLASTSEKATFIDHATKKYIVNNGTILVGEVISGMSGGPVVNENGELVGIILANSTGGPHLSYVRDLKDTYLCQKSAPVVTPGS